MKLNLELLTRIRFAYTLGVRLVDSIAPQRMWSHRILLQTTRLAADRPLEDSTINETDHRTTP